MKKFSLYESAVVAEQALIGRLRSLKHYCCAFTLFIFNNNKKGKSFWNKLALSIFVLLFSVSSVLSQEIIFSEDFESGSLSSSWSANKTENGVAGVVNRMTDVRSIAHSGNYALALGREEDIRDETVNSIDLNLDLDGQEEAILRFYIRDEADQTSEQDAIFISDDGGKNFERAMRLQPEQWGDGTYGMITLNLAAAAQNLGLELTDNFVVRFQQSGAKDFTGRNWAERDGFFIDDLSVTGKPTYSTLPYQDGFEEGALGDAWRTADSYNAGETALETEAQWGMVEPVQRLQDVPSIARTGNYALAIGRPIEGDARNSSASAVDLHLNLVDQNDATLSFYIRDEADQNDEQDAIFLSDDGGNNFQRAMRLQPEQWGDGTYGMITINLAAAAHNLGLKLTHKFIVRFQQGGAKDFAGRNWAERDGFFIDDLSVIGEPTYARLPYEDGFETGALGDSWRIADPYNAGETALETQAQWGITEPVQRLQNVSSIARTGDYALAIGRPIEGDVRNRTVSAADLHLNLNGKNKALLTFHLRDEADESDEEDAIYFSNDGGKKFSKAHEIDPRNLPDGEYNQVVIDIVARAKEMNLELTDTFVVRFQQSGAKDFAGRNWAERDGFFIDDLKIE